MNILWNTYFTDGTSYSNLYWFFPVTPHSFPHYISTIQMRHKKSVMCDWKNQWNIYMFFELHTSSSTSYAGEFIDVCLITLLHILDKPLNFNSSTLMKFVSVDCIPFSIIDGIKCMECVTDSKPVRKYTFICNIYIF